MRIIAGKHRGKRLAPIKNAAIRPTADRTREAVFSILGSLVEDAVVADLFAGTGAMGLEALSRGAKQAVFVDFNPKSLALVKKNIAILKEEENSRVVFWNLLQNAACLSAHALSYDLIFADPPYGEQALDAILDNLAKAKALGPEGTLVCEHDRSEPAPENSAFNLFDQRRYGRTLVSFFEAKG
jgi:16S rRNA (guanine966-N2)-methyltransferase